MVSSSDPDAVERFQWRYDRAIDEYKNGGTDEQLRAGLRGAGYYGAVLNNELIYQRCLRNAVTTEPVTGFVSGLPDKTR